MADTTVDEVIERLAPECRKAQLTGNPASIPMQVMVADVLALLWEIAELRVDRQEERENYETVRAERDALVKALVAIRDECNTDYESPYGLAGAIDGIVDTALNTQPQAEWTPRLGDKVRFVEGADPSWIVGMVGHITHISADTNQYAITMVAEKVERYGIRRSEFIKFGE